MELQLGAEAEAKLNNLAAQTHRSTDELLQEAIDHLINYNQWLEEKVSRSLASVELGNTVADDEVRVWVESRERN